MGEDTDYSKEFKMVTWQSDNLAPQVITLSIKEPDHPPNTQSEAMKEHPSSLSKHKTRVLLLTNSVAVGGMEEHVELLARHLDRKQFEVFAICPDWTPTLAFTHSLQAVGDHIVQITPDLRYTFWRYIKESYLLLQQLRKWKIDVLHMHSTTYRGQHSAFIAARMAGIKQIYVTEHLAPEHKLPFREHLLRNLFSRFVDGIVCVSEKNYQARKRYIYTPHERTIVVNNGVDVNDFTPIPSDILHALREQYHFPTDAQIVGTVVRLEPEKGLDDLIAALPMIRQNCPRAYLLIVGDGSLRATLEQQVDTLGMHEYVRFAGFQSDPRPYLGIIDTFVLPVPIGSMSIGLLEAMAMKRAVVITFGGKGEAVIHDESGYCAEPHNPASIAHFVTEILSNPQRQQAFGEAARQRVEQEFSAQRVAKVLGTVYLQGICSKHL
jgi:glycosyltransferase involved in cell wall biosynthesis